MAWQLSKETVKLLEDLKERLNVELEDFRMDFDERSERWQDSDKGQSVGAWLDDLEAAADELEDLPTEPDYD